MATSRGSSARERAAAARAEQQRAERRRRIMLWSAVVVVVLLVAGGIIIAVSSTGGHTTPSSASSPSASPSASASSHEALGPEGIPLEQGTVLAPASTAASGQTVDGIQCQSAEQVVYHIHAHLSVFVQGRPRPIPLGIGIVKPVVQQTNAGPFAGASHCYYWLHTHTQDGVIHIESPTRTVYTLGEFFDEWRQPLSASQVATAKGTVTAYLNGHRYAGTSPRNIPLTPHAVIQLDVGTPVVAPLSVNWSTSQL